MIGIKLYLGLHQPLNYSLQGQHTTGDLVFQQTPIQIQCFTHSMFSPPAYTGIWNGMNCYNCKDRNGPLHGSTERCQHTAHVLQACKPHRLTTCPSARAARRGEHHELTSVLLRASQPSNPPRGAHHAAPGPPTPLPACHGKFATNTSCF